jgi:hypothetical protein
MHQKLSKAESARLNGSKSRGAKTEAGKLRAANGNLKHGAYSSRVVMQGENPEAYAALLKSFIDLFLPTDVFENECVVTMTNCCWRTRRLECAETDALNAAVLLNKPRVEAAFEAVDTPTERALAIQSDHVNLERNSRAEERLHRLYDRKYKILMNYRRKAGRPMPHPAQAVPDSAAPVLTNPPNVPPQTASPSATFIALFPAPVRSAIAKLASAVGRFLPFLAKLRNSRAISLSPLQ